MVGGQALDDVLKLFPAERAGCQHAQHPVQRLRQIRSRVIAASPQRLDLLRVQTEEEHVLLSHLLADFDIRAVKRPKRHRTVDHQLHVTRAGRFLARNGDLLGDIRRRNDDLSKRHLVVLNEHNLELSVHRRVRVHHVGNRHN